MKIHEMVNKCKNKDLLMAVHHHPKLYQCLNHLWLECQQRKISVLIAEAPFPHPLDQC